MKLRAQNGTIFGVIFGCEKDERLNMICKELQLEISQTKERKKKKKLEVMF